MNVISFSLYGDGKKYQVGMLRNIELAQQWYPGWKVRIYCNHHEMRNWRHELLKAGDIQLFYNFMEEPEIPPMMWRFLVADDPTVDRFLIRDADSRIGEREAMACQEWINSDLIGWVIRDHPAHRQSILGGLWGATWRRPNWQAPNMEQMIREYLDSPRPYRTGEYCDDQLFLQTRVWPWLQNSCMQHDSVCRESYPGARPFPTKRSWPRFVGEVFDEHGNPRPGDWEQIAKDKE